MRKNIFSLLSNTTLSTQKEYERLYHLFENTRFYSYSSLLAYIDKEHFLKWKYRGRFLSVYDIMEELKITDMDINLYFNTEILLRYIEFISNMLYLIRNEILPNPSEEIRKTLKENIEDLLSDLNYKLYINDESEQVTIIEKDKKATAVAEKFPDISNSVIEYRRYNLKGDITSKKEIILKLADKIEPLRNKLNGTSYKNIIEDINMLLNNLNLRHNNLDGKYKQEYTVTMKKEDLEKWYDTVYDMILSALMLEDYIGNKKYIDELKTHY